MRAYAEEPYGAFLGEGRSNPSPALEKHVRMIPSWPA